MTGPDTEAAISALQQRGVDQTDTLIEQATPAQIMEACERWDRRSGVGPGLLAHWIRNGEYADPAQPEPAKTGQSALRDRHQRAAERWPVGSSPESHLALLARRWPDDLTGPKPATCGGRMEVISTAWPLIELSCSECGFEVAVAAREAQILGSGSEPEPF